MIIRHFGIMGGIEGIRHVARCAILGCVGDASTLTEAAQSVRQTIVTRWKAQTSDLAVQVEVSPVGRPSMVADDGAWKSTVVIVTTETPLQGITIEQRLGLPIDTGLDTRCIHHYAQADSVAAYHELRTALDWYLAQPTLSPATRMTLHDLHTRTISAIMILTDAQLHLRAYTQPYRRSDNDVAEACWN